MRYLGKSNLLGTGLGFIWGIQLTLLFSRSLLGPLSQRGADGFNYALGIGIVVACLAMYGASRAAPGLGEKLLDFAAKSFAPILMLGIGLIAFAIASPSTSLQIFAGFTSGAGIGLGYIAWFCEYAKKPFEEAHVLLLASLSIGIVVFALLAWSHTYLRIFGMFVFAILSGIFRHQFIKYADTPEEESATNAKVARTDNIMTCVAVFCIGCVYGICGHLSLNSSSVLQQNTTLWHLVLAAVGIILLAVMSHLFPRKSNVALIFRCIFPVAMVSLVILPFAADWYADIFSFVIAESYQLMEVVLFLSFSTITLRSFRFEATCLPLASNWLGITGGVLLGSFIFSATEEFNAAITTIVIATFFLFSMTLFCLSILMGKQATAAVNTTKRGSRDALAPFDQACLNISKTYFLSIREQEILSLVAKGRSRTFIAEELYLSPNTVKSYIRVLYSKIQVHSKQEVIDLVETEMSKLSDTTR